MTTDDTPNQQWPAGSDKLEPREKAALRWVVLVMGVIVSLAAVATYFSERQTRRHRDRIYKECIADGQPGYYCEGLARDATR